MTRFLKEPPRHPGDDAAQVAATVGEIVEGVRTEGLDAVRRYSSRFDRWDPPSFRVDDETIDRSIAEVEPELRRHIDFAAAQIRGFAELQRSSMTDIEEETLPGVVLGHRHIPVSSVGAYSPGGAYPLIASSLMTVVTPKAAGVERVVAVAPPRGAVGIHPPQVYAMVAAGADEIFCIGGVQALAALAFGVEGLPPVDMIIGAGNSYVS